MGRSWGKRFDGVVLISDYFLHGLDERIREYKRRGYVLLSRGTSDNIDAVKYWAKMQAPERKVEE